MNASRKRVKMLIILSKTVEEADKVIRDNYRFESVSEKIAFLKGMFDVKLIGLPKKIYGVRKDESDKMTYFAMLSSIINDYGD